MGKRSTKFWRRHGPPKGLVPFAERPLEELDRIVAENREPARAMAAAKKARRNKRGGVHSAISRKTQSDNRAAEMREMYVKLAAAGVKRIGPKLERHFGVSRWTVYRALKEM